MKYRPLGRTGLLVSEIGFGAWGLGGVHAGATSYGPVDDAVSVRAIHHALDVGVTLFDTADLYGYGHSEAVLGRALQGRRDRAVIASKVGFLNAQDQDFSPAHIRRSIEDSLRRLQTDYIDVYQLHNPPVETMVGDHPAIDEMQRLRRDGLVRVFGVSLRSPADGFKALEESGAETLQVNFNMIDQRPHESGLLEACRQRGVGVIGRTPLCYGFLTGKYTGAASFPDGDHRRDWPEAQRAVWAGAPAFFEPIRARQRQTAGQLALRFCLSYDAVSSVIPGMLSVDQVDENVRASELGPLPVADREQVEQIYGTRQFFVARPAVASSAGSR